MARTAINSSAIHVFEVLRLVSRSNEALGVSEISRRLGLPGSTVYRALITLEESGYLARYQNMPRYELGHMPRLLNRGLLHRFRLFGASRPHLRRLAEQTGDTASIVVRVGWYALRLAGVYGSHDIYHHERLGEVAPLHRGPGGRAILAALPDAERDAFAAFAARNRFEPLPEEALAEARASAMVRNRQGAALPVKTPTGEVLAAIVISGENLAADDEVHWSAARAALEAEIAEDPGAFASPFAHIPADEIVIDLRREPAESIGG